MEKSFIDYAMSVIVQRALPSVEDGLKPVHRRILYAMHSIGLDSSKPTMKCARIVGEAMGKFHPHGNLAIYDSLVRMAQPFSLRYPLVHGQGNFGCFTADTKIALADGRNLTFKELIEEDKNGKENFCYTIKKDGSIGIEKIENPRMTKNNAEVIKIVLDNDEEIVCTPDHKFMLRDGLYKEAKGITKVDSLMPLYNEIELKTKVNHKIKKIEWLNEKKDVYDIEVPNTHNFALAAGIFVHNSLDGDSAAADRYTEAKLSKISKELLEDIDKDTVNMVPNFDNSLKEPQTLPARLPNLLLNGATGIAVGMATNIPPHNLTEICEAIISYINKPSITVDELAEIVTGPDFPTGGIISGQGIKEMYKTGKGKIVMRGRLKEEESKTGKPLIIVTEIPYMVNKAELVKEIARLATDKKLPDVADLRDESAKGNVRIVIELKKGVDPKYTINKLYKMTNLQTNFDANVLALVGNQPRILNLKEIVVEYVKYRQLVVTNRSKFELKKAEGRLEIVLGLLIALKQIDKIVEFIKKSENATTAHQGLMSKFGFTDRQAKAVLETRLQQLTSLEAGKLKEEENKLKELIIYLKKLLGSEQEILSLIKKEVQELK
ncbi:MAG: DNA gyrase subunit A, partial [Nanoarchaeota archaeon]|nr:DNA gyrase subunit A [Nanoarchaeota archaeon]